jgi:putative NIF3 family GTP cyclohydrolase 1 type 2
VRFQSPQSLGSLSQEIRKGLGNLSGLSIAVPQSILPQQKSNIKISSVGICAGSGGSYLNGLDVDLLFTGELSHHEALAAIEQGKCVITAFHSNTEREFLKRKMLPALQSELDTIAKEDKENRFGPDFGVAVSEVDRDPFEIITSDQAGW